MKHSIRVKLAVLIVTIMAVSIGAVILYSSFFVEKYYSATKQTSIKSVYYYLKDIIDKDENLEKSDNVRKLNNICERTGTTLILVDSNGNVLFDYGAGKIGRAHV